MRFDHIGVFVADIEHGRAFLRTLLPIARESETIHDPLLQVAVQFLYDMSGICYELVAPNGPKNPVETVLKTRKNVLNHVAYRVDKIEPKLAELRDAGCLPITEARPAVAFGGRRVIFLYTPLNFIIELVEETTGA
jgi:methylmalonyl-CoA/ethylmalonyl-CoA epimerase